jgi:hypothetical protein
MFTEPQTVYMFRCSANWKRHAATLEKSGRNLPATSCSGGVWRFLESHRISDATSRGASDDAMRASLASDGWYVWDAPADARVTRPPGKAA